MSSQSIPPLMHDDEIVVDESVVRRLIGVHFPQWSRLPLRRVLSGATVNAIFRLGDDLSVRLPRIPRYHDVEAEVCWLGTLAPKLPIPIPEAVAIGEPDEKYPWKWAIFRWIEGEPWQMGAVKFPRAAAAQLAAFLQVLHEQDSKAWSCPPPVGVRRLAASVDSALRGYAEKASGLVDVATVLGAWEKVQDVPEWEGVPVLVHGDVLAGNVLVRDGQLVAVIDWAGLHAGDPALDLTPAWSLFSGDARVVFKEAMGFDDDSWARARGWALTRVIGVGYYLSTNPAFVADSLQVLSEALSDPDELWS